MSFACPECLTSGSLKVAGQSELGPHAAWDKITLQSVRCSRCGFRAVAVCLESRRGELDSETVHHTGYRVSEADLRAMDRAIGRCRDRLNPRCGYAAHRTLGQKDPATGRWSGLPGMEGAASFPMQLAGGR